MGMASGQQNIRTTYAQRFSSTFLEEVEEEKELADPT